MFEDGPPETTGNQITVQTNDIKDWQENKIQIKVPSQGLTPGTAYYIKVSSGGVISYKSGGQNDEAKFMSSKLTSNLFCLSVIVSPPTKSGHFYQSVLLFRKKVRSFTNRTASPYHLCPAMWQATVYQQESLGHMHFVNPMLPILVCGHLDYISLYQLYKGYQ